MDRKEKRANNNVKKYSKRKFKVLSLGRNKPMHEYMLGLDNWKASGEEKSLMNRKLKIRQQWSIAEKEASNLPGSIRKDTVRRLWELVLPPNSALERPPLECCVQV